ncbi:NUDIX hydrolase [uncultured Tateyamaria sp.]|uniref:NUDIX hydrolase n=1 Tax=uncultured Tateyamaria sp. TaxID=455651 RepID=UPI00262BC8C0|nr:NUDIX hydrolase [uncultured Tateyamaria sp.]
MAGQVIGAKLALFVGDKLVSLQRDNTPGLLWAGYWDLPGGGIEPGETPLACVLRETHEELTLAMGAEQVSWGRPYGTSSGDISWFFAAHLAARVADDIVLGDEGQGWKLMTVDAFLSDAMVVPQFKSRLMDYLAGVPAAPDLGG